MGPGVVFQSIGSPSFERLMEGFQIVFAYGPIWMPPVFAYAAWQMWIKYRRARFIASQEMVVLEVRFPQETLKSPAAMESAFEHMILGSGESSFVGRLFEGKVRPWWSFEFASFEGQVHFFIWTRAGFRKQTERALYAQYPNVEIVVADDYAARFPFDFNTHNVWGCDFVLKQSDAFPIKTFVDYKLDQATLKEEQKIDPLSNFIETLGTLGKGEYFWFQFLVRTNKREPAIPGTPIGVTEFKDRAVAAIKSIRKSPEDTTYFTDKEYKVLSEHQKDQIKGIERKLYAKYQYDVGVRGMYIAENNAFEGVNIPTVLNMFRTFSAPGYNGFSVTRFDAKYDYPWQDWEGRRQRYDKLKLIDAYRRRSWFHPPYHYRAFVLSSEELATLIHVPGSVVETPSLPRIPSKREEAPVNLPV